jgi:hypothetical protein
VNTDLINLDFYNNSFYIKLDGLEYFTDSAAKFLNDSNFPYVGTVKLLAYEPARNFYVVEYSDGLTDSGVDLDPIRWFTEHKEHLTFVIANVTQMEMPVETLEMERSLRFADTDWVLQRNQEQLLLNIPPSLDQTQVIDLLNYRQQLRELTNTYSKDTPVNEVVWPRNPLNQPQ